MPPLDPTTISGLKVWLDASDPASFTYSSGTLVSQWNDKSGTGFHFAHPTPSYQPSRSGLRAGLPTVVFDGGRTLERRVATPFTTAAATIFIVCGAFTHKDYAGFLSACVAAGNDYDQPNGFDINQSVGSTILHVDRNAAASTVPGTTPTPFSVYTAVLGTPAGGATAYRHGVAGTPGGSGATGTPPGLCMGMRWLSAAASTAYGVNGEIAELLIYDRILTTTERQNVEQHLKEKWVLPLVVADTVTVSDIPPSQFFKPSDLTGLKLHLDASILTPGQAYSTWPNLAAGGVASLAAYSAPAPVVTTPQAGQNGLPVMRYTAPGGHQTTAVQVDRDQTMVVVARMIGTANQRLIGGVESVNNFLIGWHGGDWDVAHMDGWLTNATSGIPTGTTWKMYSLDSASAGFLPRFFANGIQLPTGTGAGQGWRNTFSLGGGSSYGGQPSNCEVAEVILYNRKLSDVERQQVEAYLRAKWLTPGLALTLGPSDGLADTVALSDTAEVGFQFAQTMPPDTVTVTDVLGLETSMVFADGVNVSDADPIWGAAHFVEPAETVTTSDLFGTQIGEYIIPCTPDPIAGNFESGEAVVGTWFACAKKGILGLGGIAPALTIRNLAAEPAGLQLGGEGALFVGQKPTIPGGGMYLGGYAPGLSLHLTPPLGILALRGRVPLNVGLEPPIYPAGLELGGSTPKFAGREPPVSSAGLGLGAIVPGFRFSQTLAAPVAGLGLGGGIPVQVETILIIPVYEWPVDLAGVVVDDETTSAVAVVSIDLLSSPAQPVTLGDVDTVDSDDLNEVECV